ncbi:MAG: hypothetical protein ACR2GY_01395 [Phycisphaerales bacterium]
MTEAHIRQWKHNRSFLETIGPEYPDWAVSTVFYAALHAIDALLTSDRVEGIVSHETRNRALMKTNRYAKLWDLYQPLHDLSRTIRYLADPQLWVAWDAIDKEVVRRYLYPIEKSVLKLMKKDLDLPKIQLAPPVSDDSSTVPQRGAVE